MFEERSSGLEEFEMLMIVGSFDASNVYRRTSASLMIKYFQFVSVIIDARMLHYIQSCIKSEACARLQNDAWTKTVVELQASLAIMHVYARGVLGATD